MPWRRARVDRGALVRVLAVAQRAQALGLDREVLGQVALGLEGLLREPGGDGAVVRGGVREGARGELAALGERGAPGPSASMIADSGETAIATFAKFFAEARTIAGPPMSICSTTASPTAPEATVSTNG
jgi:hypothetical protein